MKIFFSVLFVLIGTVFTADATTVTTNMFSIDVPDQWRVEDNKTSIILAFGSKLVDGTSLPFLSVQYCVNGDQSKDSNRHHCSLPCNEEAANLVSRVSLEGALFSPVTKMEKTNGVTEYSSELSTASRMAALVALSCSNLGQIHLALVSDLASEDAKQQFADILKSLKWK